MLCPLTECFFSFVLYLNKCKHRHSSLLKNAEQAWLRVMLRGEEFDVLQAVTALKAVIGLNKKVQLIVEDKSICRTLCVLAVF